MEETPSSNITGPTVFPGFSSFLLDRGRAVLSLALGNCQNSAVVHVSCVARVSAVTDAEQVH